jgi:hypothetical protein
MKSSKKTNFKSFAKKKKQQSKEWGWNIIGKKIISDSINSN